MLMDQGDAKQRLVEKPTFLKSKWWMLIGGIFIGLMSAGVVLITSKPPQGAAILLRPPPTTKPIAVHITGAVAKPGVYHLPINSRVEDVIQEAGGVISSADIEMVNMAATLEDGMKVNIPQKSTAVVAVNVADVSDSETENEKTDEEENNVPSSTFPVNINTATQAELETLPGVGPVTAQKIIAYRTENPFQLIEEIQKVPGIGPATFEKLKDLITVGSGK